MNLSLERNIKSVSVKLFQQGFVDIYLDSSVAGRGQSLIVLL